MGRWSVLLAMVLASCSAASRNAPSASATDALALKTGDDLLAVCSESAVGMEMAFIAYIASAVDSYGITFCPTPAGSTRGQARDLVVQYLREHPQERQGQAIGEVWQALSQTWPCAKPAPKKR